MNLLWPRKERTQAASMGAMKVMTVASAKGRYTRLSIKALEQAGD